MIGTAELGKGIWKMPDPLAKCAIYTSLGRGPMPFVARLHGVAYGVRCHVAGTGGTCHRLRKGAQAAGKGGRTAPERKSAAAPYKEASPHPAARIRRAYPLSTIRPPRRHTALPPEWCFVPQARDHLTPYAFRSSAHEMITGRRSRPSRKSQLMTQRCFRSRQRDRCGSLRQAARSVSCAAHPNLSR